MMESYTTSPEAFERLRRARRTWEVALEQYRAKRTPSEAAAERRAREEEWECLAPGVRAAILAETPWRAPH